MSRTRTAAVLGAAAAIAAPAASALASTSHATLWHNKADTVVCGVEIHAASKPAKYLICSAKGIPKAKTGVGDPFVQIAKTGKAQLVLESQRPFVGSQAKTIAGGDEWQRLGVTCTVGSGKTVSCQNSSKHGFKIGNGSYKSF